MNALLLLVHLWNKDQGQPLGFFRTEYDNTPEWKIPANTY
jgi:hypothetical protein